MPRDRTLYFDQTELADYVWRNYAYLFSQLEHRVTAVMRFREKADAASSEQIKMYLLSYAGSSLEDPAVEELLADGVVTFRTSAAERVMSSHKDFVFINRCERCRCVVASPRARQCLWCGFDWHDRQPKVD